MALPLAALSLLACLVFLSAPAAARQPKALDARRRQLASQVPPAAAGSAAAAAAAGSAAAGAGGCACFDAAPPGGSPADCNRLRDTGSCYSVWMVAADACALTCGRCTPCTCTCTDVPPDGAFTCAQQAAWGKCGEAWMLRLFCQQSCRRCACPFGGTAAPASPLSLATGSSSSSPAVTAAAEPAVAAVAADPPSPAANGSSTRAADGTAWPASSRSPADGTAAAAPSHAANSSGPSPPSAGPDTPQQQMVDPLFDALQSFVSANTANGSGGGGAGPGGCRTDVLNFLRSAPDLSLYLSLAVLTGWQHTYLANASLAATLLLPTDTAVRAFLQQQALTPESVYATSGQLESLLAYHTLPTPLTYTELTQASTSRASLVTELPGAFLEAQPVNATALRLSGEYSSAALLRSNVALCRTVVHVLDAVLLPTRTIQQVVPFDVAADKGSSAASTTIGSSGGSSGGPLAGLTGSGGRGSSSTASPTSAPSPSATAASLEAASRSSPQQAASVAPAAPAAAGQSGCFRSIAAAINASPQLTIDKTIAFLAGWDFGHPGLNVTLFLPSDSAQQMALASLMQSGGGNDSQLLVSLARDSRLLHASLAYGIVVAGGGLPMEALQQMSGRNLSSLFTNHSLSIQAGQQSGSVQVLPEFGNATRVLQSLSTCGGSVIHIVDGPLTARTPLVEHWSAGQPSANLSAAYEGYSPEAAQAAVDATAMGAATGSSNGSGTSGGDGSGNGSSGSGSSNDAAVGSLAAAAPASPSSGGASSQAPQPSPSAAVEPTVALSLLRSGGSPTSWASQPVGSSSSSSAPSGPAQLALNLSLSLPLEAAATSGQQAAQPASSPVAAPSPAPPAAAASPSSPSPAPAAAPQAETAQTKSAPVATAAAQLAAASSGAVPAPPLPPLVVPATAPPAVLPAPSPIVEATSGAPNNSSGGEVRATDDQDCVTLRAVVETSPQMFSHMRDVVARFGWFAAAPQLDSVTFLLPTDAALDAFAARFKGSTLEAVLASPQALQALASYHVLEDRMSSDQLYEGQRLQTLARDAQGKPLALTVHRSGPGTTSFQGAGSTASLMVPDVPVCGGIIQVIDQVLLPVPVPAAAAGVPAGPPPSGSSSAADAAAAAG